MNEWLEKFGWRENPFNFKIYSDLLVGYKKELTKLNQAIEAENKFSVLVGETGAGKTTMLKWITTHCANNGSVSNVTYMPKPPKNEENFLQFLRDELLNPGFFKKLFNSYSLYNIHHELEKEMNEHSLLVIDEGHEASVEVLEWVRTVIDHVDNLTVITAGLPEFEETLSNEVHTLYNRSTNIVKLQSLNKDETFSLVRKRIEKVGGQSLEPFTQSAILKIYDYTEGFPREILRACNSCLIHASQNDFSFIEESDVVEILDEEEFIEKNEEGKDNDDSEEEEKQVGHTDLELTPKQEKVVDQLEEHGALTSGEIADIIDTDNYSSRSHAVRSINNILKRLRDNGIVEREREGRSYKYFLESS